MSTKAETGLVIYDVDDYGAMPHRRNRYCVNPRELTLEPAPQPALDAGGDDSHRYLHSEIQHLLETQAKLVEALERRVSPTKCYCDVVLGAKCGECADRELLRSLGAQLQEKQ